MSETGIPVTEQIQSVKPADRDDCWRYGAGSSLDQSGNSEGDHAMSNDVMKEVTPLDQAALRQHIGA